MNGSNSNRILIVSWSFYPYLGGMEEQSFLLAEEYVSKGYSVDVLTESRTKDQKREDKINNISIYRTRYFPKRNVFAYIGMAYDYFRFFIKNKNYSFVIIRGAMTFEPLLIGLFKLLRVVTSPTFVTADTGGPKDEIALVANSKFKNLFSFITNRHDYLNAICEANIENYKRLDVKNEKITFIQNGINILKKRNNFPKKIEKYGYLGRLEKIKGVVELIESFKIASDINHKISLTIGGDGSQMDTISKTIKKYGLGNRIKLIGRVESEEKTNFFNKIDCLILPSLSEGLPLVVLEAMNYNKPMIVTRVSDLEKMIGSQAEVVSPGNITELAHAIHNFPVKYVQEKMNYTNILKKYSIQETASKIENLFINTQQL